MNYIYLVVGDTGELSDHTQWFVAAYTEKEQAEQHAQLANQAVKGIEDLEWNAQDQARANNHYDRGCKVYYTGTKYRVQAVPLVRHVDEYLELPKQQGE